jgi:hypothetical protein
VLQHLKGSQVAYLTGRSFFPRLIEQPFANGLGLAFDFAAGATLIAVVASALRGKRYVHQAPAAGTTGGAGEAAAGVALARGAGPSTEIGPSTETVPSTGVVTR